MIRFEDIKNNSNIKVGSYVQIMNEMDKPEWWLIVHYDDRTQFRQFSISQEYIDDFDFATAYGNANVNNKYSSINLSVDDGLLTFNSTKKDLKGIKLKYKELLKENERYSIKIKCEKVNDEKYSLSLYVNSNDPVDILKIKFDPTEDVERKSNFIGKSNNQNDGMFTGTLYSFELKLAAHAVDYYLPPTIYEFDTAYSDFDKPIKYELETKGINLKYPQHIKKLKHIFVKARGGYQPNDLIFELYTDGYLENDPKSYYCYVDDTGQIVYNYEKESNLTIDENENIYLLYIPFS